MPQIGFDHRAVTIDGKRTLLLSGAIHYPRSTPAMWPDLMRRSRDAGLNAIETYVFWNLHERERGVFDFSDRLDVRRFCEVAAEHGLHVILRIGPYICAETNYGGYPAWMRDVPGLKFRTMNQPYLLEKERWVRLLCDHMRGLFAPEGGPIIAAQIENEYDNVAKNYGDDAPRYLKWCIELSRDLNLGVPWLMCLGHGGAGSVKGAIATVNAFHAHKRLDEHLAAFPTQPALWTENWPGWYDTWGYGHHRRDARDVAYGVARFIAGGGTGVNYYMWHGGTNFAREAMYLQTTSYDFDAPLDEFALTTTKSNHLAALHRILRDHAGAIVGRERPKPRTLDGQATAYTYGKLTFLCNDSSDAVTATLSGKTYRLPGRSVSLLVGGKVALNTAEVASGRVVKRRMTPIARALGRWSSWREPMPWDAPDAAAVSLASKQPIEQLQLTQDQTDYCWYSTLLNARGRGELVLSGVADAAHVFVDGELAATTPTPLGEDRGRFTDPSWTQRFELDLKPGKHVLSILCCAVGLIKGDWQIGQQNMAEERKGLWGRAMWKGKPLREWVMTPGSFGERAGVPDGGDALLQWTGDVSGASGPMTWWRCEVATPPGREPLALDMTGMTKGLIWLNGRCAGRHWLCAAAKSGVAAWQAEALHEDKLGPPTQRYYHLPRDWFAPPGRANTLIVLDELGGSPSRVRLVKRV
jgi:beta-galactosidase